MMYLMVAVGLIILLVGGDVLVRGAVSLSQRLGISPLVIGLTVVALGTSAPELVVCVNAALEGVPELAIGNVVGSNIANVLLVLGLPALIFPVAGGVQNIRRDGTLMVLVTLGFVLLCWSGAITQWQGVIMVLLLIGFLSWSYIAMRFRGTRDASGFADEIDDIATRTQSVWVSGAFVILGLIGLTVGASFLVEGAVALARAAEIPDEIIGLTLVAIGTSLPELATALVAALRRHGDVAVGNVIGSNLFNILGIMGTTAIVRPVPVPAQFVGFDLWVMFGAALLVMPFAYNGRAMGRVAGGLFAVAYLVYILALFHGLSAVGQQAST